MQSPGQRELAGRRLKVAIVSTGRKQRDVAESLKITETDLSRYVAGTTPRVELAIRIASEIGTTVEAIWGEQEALAA